MSQLNKMEKYLLENLSRLAKEGTIDENPRPKYEDGSPAHTIFINGVYETYDIANGEFPITETREISIEKAIQEIRVFTQLQSSKIKDFEAYGVKWWKPWSVGDGDTIGQRYGATIKKYDLMNKLLDGLVDDPFSRRHILNLYQYADFEETEGIYPCCYESIWSVSKRTNDDSLYLDCTMVQRSSDVLVAGTGINQMQYVALQMMIATHCGYKAGKFNHLRQSYHIYDKHIEQAEETIKRIHQLKQREEQTSPKLILNVPNKTNFYEITIDNFELVDYNPIKPQMKFELGI
ncbi:thymidylate synthase [Lysinibacillus sp. NPDC086135]|uniref:thymidylate synthase n=1 Tax=Lysinibacillus sp. NPDC086135 TaxID=3364130 RepID=UPI00380542A6